MGTWCSATGEPINECPRGGLQRLLNILSTDHNISITLGFEIELTLLRRREQSLHPPSLNLNTNSDPYEPLTTNHAWSTLTPQQSTLALPLLAAIAKALGDTGIHIQQFHAESGAGQYEFVLPPAPALEAIDTLYQARQVIFQMAAREGLRATLHPAPYPGVGTAAHAHVSLGSSSTRNGGGGADADEDGSEMMTAVMEEEKEMRFFAGVMQHLDAICAFTLPEADSYDRVADDSWTGGTWVAWGTQNRETPLRRVERGRWEVRCLDGIANMYLAVAAILAAGVVGLEEGKKMVWEDCLSEYLRPLPELAADDASIGNPSGLSEEERKSLGIERRLPTDIESAITALGRDDELRTTLTDGLVNDYIIMKKAEQQMFGKMSKDERRVWLLERY
ncbi:hypothetical protein LTS18_011945 [Coniosporium uncinatum]|uniref:Uncharacterized protein n=1 Tax=Coniosporium uncinatum TaxID=93489 RepID=A0ACC3DK13_9PEZI|nr:hypothetical protein LTS18_011945 [Coniosporium uncinatum]